MITIFCSLALTERYSALTVDRKEYFKLIYDHNKEWSTQHTAKCC